MDLKPIGGEIWNANQPTVPSKPQDSNLVSMVESAALAGYDPFESMEYDGHVMNNGYVWVSYIDYGGTRRYTAVSPDDGCINTRWGREFFNKHIFFSPIKFK